MSTTDTESAVATLENYVPFTPFQDNYTFEAEPAFPGEFEQSAVAPISSPFVSEYEGLQTAVSAETIQVHELLFDLYDRELDETLRQIAEEAWNAVNDRAEMFGETAGAGSAEQFLQEWITPVRIQAETMIDNVAEALTAGDPASMSAAELDQLFERLTPRGTGLEPYFEDFLGGLGKKLKKIASKAIEVGSMVMLPGVGLLISKLKPLLMPLLQRVLNIALDKLPPTLRPVARQLAQRLLGTKVSSEDSEDFDASPTTPNLETIQQQFDLDTASLLFAEETEQEVIVQEAAQEAERVDGAPIAQLHEARARFIDELERGVDPQEALENFIPILGPYTPIARTAIGIIGRPRVVKFLAGFLAKFVGKYVPQPAATQLSQAIVDTGMRMMSLETPTGAEVQQLAPEAIAATVEDTVRRVAAFDEATYEHPALLEAAVTEAFHEAAAENFPQSLLIPELHEASAAGAWVSMPLGKRRKYYKKYTRVFDVQITPQIASAVKTFGGTTLAAFLKDQLGVTAPVQARVHLYQALIGTTPARIARFERGIPGLGTAARSASSQIHPLTPEAASALLQEPRLGRRVSGNSLSTRGRLSVGQRLYYLEIAGARPAPPPTIAGGTQAAVRRSSEVNVTLDFPKDEFRVFVYLSEADAQDIATKLRNKDVTAVLVAAKKIYAAGVATALSGDIRRHVKILSEGVEHEGFFGGLLKQLTDTVKQQLTHKVISWVGKAVADYVTARSGELIAATEDPADGATVVVTIVNPPGAPLVRKLLSGNFDPTGALADVQSMFKGDPKLAVATVPGFRFD
jgi:hypothetical protein